MERNQLEHHLLTNNEQTSVARRHRLTKELCTAAAQVLRAKRDRERKTDRERERIREREREKEE